MRRFAIVVFLWSSLVAAECDGAAPCISGLDETSLVQLKQSVKIATAQQRPMAPQWQLPSLVAATGSSHGAPPPDSFPMQMPFAPPAHFAMPPPHFPMQMPFAPPAAMLGGPSIESFRAHPSTDFGVRHGSYMPPPGYMFPMMMAPQGYMPPEYPREMPAMGPSMMEDTGDKIGMHSHSHSQVEQALAAKVAAEKRQAAQLKRQQDAQAKDYIANRKREEEAYYRTKQASDSATMQQSKIKKQREESMEIAKQQSAEQQFAQAQAQRKAHELVAWRANDAKEAQAYAMQKAAEAKAFGLPPAAPMAGAMGASIGGGAPQSLENLANNAGLPAQAYASHLRSDYY